MLQGFGQLQAACLRHADVEEHHIARIFLQLFNSLANACRFGNDFGLAKLVQEELELGTRWGFIVDNDRFKHLGAPFRYEPTARDAHNAAHEHSQYKANASTSHRGC